jgi:hypothetical protein
VEAGFVSTATSSVASVVVATLLSAVNALDNMTTRNMNTLNSFINVPLAALEILAGDIQQTQGVAVIHFLQNGVIAAGGGKDPKSASGGVYVAFALPTNLLKESSTQQNKH